MKDFLLIFRSEYNETPIGTPEQMEANMQQWMAWLQNIAEQGKLTERGNRLARSGRVLRPGDVVTNGPYIDIKEAIGGYTIIKADSYDDAIGMLKGCPILMVGGNVEVRELDSM